MSVLGLGLQAPVAGAEALVIGFAVTGQATAAVLKARGWTVHTVDDATGESLASLRETAGRLGVQLHAGLAPAALAELSGRARLIVLSPGIPPSHPIFTTADPSRTIAEIELGWRLLDGAVASTGARPRLVAVTGTNGKTTVTSLVTAMLEASGMSAVAGGNIGRPLVEIAAEHAAGTPGSPSVIVAEVSSFQLAWTRSFRPDVSCWLNFAEDHLDWHRDLEDYAEAKARVWANQSAADLAVVNADDPVVMRFAAGCPARLVTFGARTADYSFAVAGGQLVGPDGSTLVTAGDLPRSLPHDLANAAAGTAVALAAGATPDGCRQALRTGVQMPHRIELVGESGGVSFYDDSKATTPSAVVAALAGFGSVVLIAGGRNKGLDLGAIPRSLDRPERIRAVVAIGESAGDVERVFAAVCPVKPASSMDEAVAVATSLARPGDAVVLSPGCASFDWYRSYGERGDDFARAVRDRAGAGTSGRRMS